MQLQRFTSIISLLAVQQPQLSNQLNLLRNAISKWYEGVEQLIMQKNRMIMKAKTRGNEKLLVLFKEIQNFFDNLLKNYSDPNLPYFVRAFKKIKEQFQFIDIDWSRYEKKYKQEQAQTDKQNYIMFGVDMQKFMKNLEQKQEQVQKSKIKIIQLQDNNIKLKNQINGLMEQMKKDGDEYAYKIKQLMQYLQKAKSDQIRNQGQTEKRSLKYRSNPQITLYQSPNKQVIRNLLQHAYDNSLLQPSDDSQSETNNAGTDLHRFLFCQALAIQGILENVAAHQHLQ